MTCRDQILPSGYPGCAVSGYTKDDLRAIPFRAVLGID